MKNLGDTEEVKPGIFVQKKDGSYRVVQPLTWNGRFRWKEQLRASWGNLFTLGMVLFLVWAYLHDVSALDQHCQTIIDNPEEFCQGYSKNNLDVMDPQLEYPFNASKEGEINITEVYK